LHSQSWRTQADSLVINHIFADKVGHVDIFSFPDILTNNDTIFLVDGDTILIPYTNCNGYFIDLIPSAGWAHPCKYCFVNPSGNYELFSSEMPPINDSILSLSLKPRSIPHSKPVAFGNDKPSDPVHGDHDHQWAVLICGEHEGNGNEQRFWFDLSCVYTVLTEKYGFLEATAEEEINRRHIIVTAPHGIATYYGLPNSIYGDLNGNDSYVCDFFSSDEESITQHNRENIEDIFGCFAGDNDCVQKYAQYGLRELNAKDQLFIYITGHGRQDSHDGRCYIPINTQDKSDNQRIYDDELVEMLRGIKCSQMTIMMQTCHAGGFVDKFIDDISRNDCLCKNRIGLSSSSADGIAHNDEYGIPWDRNRDYNLYWVGEFTYYWTAAALGYYPVFHIEETSGHKLVDVGPWSVPLYGRGVGDNSMDWSTYFDNENQKPHSNHDVNPDTDSDGAVSLHEQFVFANDLETWSLFGYYNIHPNIDTLDESFTRDYPQQRYESTFTKEAATLAGYQGQIDSITDSGTAMQPYRLCGDIWISPDSQLTMFDTIQSPEDVNIYIKPSGKMTLDGGTLTNLPEENSPMWKGVQVWGDAQKSQRAESGKYMQGYFELKNGATLENAVTGIDVWKPGDEHSTGGIVVASDASFVNNTTAVFFHPYENKQESANQPGTYTVRDNISSFKNCVFSIDNNYIGPDLFEMHVNLFRVRGVKFLGCDFRFSDTPFSKPWPMGLHAWDAGFHIRGLCLPDVSPCLVYDKSTFDGFYKAVASVTEGAIGLRPISVKDTEFSNNSFGVFGVKSNFATVLNSSFSIGQDSTLCAAGVYLEYSPHFTIEQDTFAVAKLFPYKNYGIVIKDSRSQNIIYKNVLRKLYCANLSVGRNSTNSYRTDINDNSPLIMGLEYRCNDNSQNLCDFYVLADGSNGMGIQKNQGATCVPANNTFSQNLSYNFMNYANYDIVYYHNPDMGNGSPSVVHKVIPTTTTDTIGCPSHYDQGGGGLGNDTLVPGPSEGFRAQREADYYEAYTAFQSIKALYDSRIDGGDTEEEVGDIQSATPSDMWELRAQLLGHSPYLTNVVLTSAAERDDVFPQSVLFEILSSNPDELRNDTLISYLRNMDNPLPDYMIGLLQQIASGITARTAMESQMAYYGQEYQRAAGDVVRSIANDSVIDMNALVAWLGNMDELESDREIVSLYMEEGNFENALSLANMLPTLYNLTGDDLAEHNDYMAMLTLYKKLFIDGRSIMQLDMLERALVEHTADYSSGIPQAMAKAIMMEAYGYRYSDCPSGVNLEYPVKGLGQMGAVFSDEDMDKAMGFSVNVSPNPARTWVTVDYTLPIGTSHAQFKVFNIHGKAVATRDLQGTESQKVLDLRGLTPGVYTYSVSCGKLTQTGKLVIVK
jgi:hypothetical protein